MADGETKAPSDWRGLGWVLVPAAVGAILAGLGGWWLRGWSEMDGWARVGAVLLTALGTLVLGLAAAWVILVQSLRRLGRGIKKSAGDLVWTAKYMLRGGRGGGS